MPFAAGSRVTAAALNRITSNSVEVILASTYTATTSAADVPGLSITVTTTQANTKVDITASLDCELVSGADFLIVSCNVGGSNLSGDMNFKADARAPLGYTWVTTLGSVGTHTIKLRAVKLGAADTVTINSGHSRLSVTGNGIS